MNNAFFFDSVEANPLPPEEVRITGISAEPYPDGQRVRVMVEMSPFQVRPNLELVLLDMEGEEVATANIIEPMNYKIELTLHIRREDPAGTYRLDARLFYPEKPDNDRREITFDIKGG
jgi:hypothetical protein